MKADRLLTELLLLQAHGQMSAREIAERLEISPRTAQRDMEALCLAGVPLVALRGAEGGWGLDPNWRTQVPAMDEEELRAMLMAQPSSLGDPQLAAAAERAFGKLMAAMPVPLQAQAQSLRARLHIDPSGWRPFNEDLRMLPVVQEAVQQDRKLAFRYPKASGPEGRTVDPLGLVSKQGVWYLVARTPNGMRTYRVSRMTEAQVLPMGAQRPAEFDLAEYWREAAARFVREREPFTASLELSEGAVKSVGGWCPLRRVREGVFELEFESRSHARFVVLGLGSEARVVGPADFAREVAEEVGRMAGR